MRSWHMRVLIVEDIPDEAELVADMVAHHGHDPLLAATAEVAIDRLTVSPPDAVILDMSLPGMGGLELLQIIRESFRELPVVAISPVATEDEALRCLRLGAMDFLPKPFSVAQIGIVLDRLQAQLRTSRRTEDTYKVDRRRYPRVNVSVEVTVEGLMGREWQCYSVNLSPFGIKLRGAGDVPPRRTAQLSFALRDGTPPISVLALLVRADPDGQAFAFIDLIKPDFNRLKNLVDSRLALAS